MRPVPVPHPLTTARPGGNEGRKEHTMKPYTISVPGSVISAKTARGYLRRTAAFLLSPARFSMESCAVLSDIESRIVSAGFLTWEQAEQIEEEVAE